MQKSYITEDEVTQIFADHLIEKGWIITSRARGYSRGADIVAEKNGKNLYIEAKGGGSQSKTTKRYGLPFNRLQCQKHTDVAFACIPRMISRYNPDYVGIVLHNDEHHSKSINQILHGVEKLGAGAWLVGQDRKIKTLLEPVLISKPIK